MNIEIDRSKPFIVAHVAGVLDTHHAETFIETLGELVHAQDAVLVIDLAGLDMIDSTGLSALINLVTRARLANARVILASPSAFVSGILEVTHLDHWFEVFATLEEASKSLS